MHHAEQVIPDVAFALPTNGQHVGSAIIDGSEVRFPRGRLKIVIEHLDEGTFARSALTDKTEDFARVSIEGDSPRRIFERARSAAFFRHGYRGAYCLFYGGHQVLASKLPVGSFDLFTTYVAILIRPISSLGRVINLMQRGFASVGRLQELFDQQPKIVSPARQAMLPGSRKVEGG
jgi:ABC-type multidrug transport system fused ATPase/permease subunit